MNAQFVDALEHIKMCIRMGHCWGGCDERTSLASSTAYYWALRVPNDGASYVFDYDYSADKTGSVALFETRGVKTPGAEIQLYNKNRKERIQSDKPVPDGMHFYYSGTAPGHDANSLIMLEIFELDSISGGASGSLGSGGSEHILRNGYWYMIRVYPRASSCQAAINVRIRHY